MRKQAIYSLLVAAIFVVLNVSKLYAQPCVVPCDGAWTDVQDSFISTAVNGHVGCVYKFKLRYRYRTCMGIKQVDMTSYGMGAVIENMMGSGCDLHCIDVPALKKEIYYRIIAVRGPIVIAEPSPCYYLGSIITPPGAEACMGMTPGTRRFMMVPCDTFGCCYSKLENVFNGVKQTVISSTACPNIPKNYSTWAIKWGCDIAGGGAMTFIVTFIPDNPLVCQNTCSNGIYNFAAMHKDAEEDSNTYNVIATNNRSGITGFNIFPNPAKDYCYISFNSDKAGESVGLEVSDIVGKVIVRTEVLTGEGNQNIKVDMRNLVTGIYTCKLTYGNQVYWGKILK